MAFDYDKLKEKQNNDSNSWTSNSDLFMVLSLVFLLLYVVSSLRNGSNSVQKSIRYEELKKRNTDLEEQILAYEALKDDYLEKKASQNEMDMYQELMGKLTLLQEEADEEKNELRKRALAHEEKERALNKYQQLVRNIINTNLLAQQRIKTRDKKIVERDQTISENEKTIAQNNRVISDQKVEISQKKKIIEDKKKIIEEKIRILAQKKSQITKLKTDISQKRKIIASNERKIDKINNDLDKKIRQLNREYKRHKKSKRQLKNRISKLRKASYRQIAKLQNLNKKTNTALKSVNQSLSSAQSQIEQANNTIALQKREQEKLDQELEKASKKLEEDRIAFAVRLDNLHQEHVKKMRREKQAFEASLKKQKLSLAEQKRRMAAFQKDRERKEEELAQKISQLNTNITDVNRQLTSAQVEKRKLAQNLERSRKKHQSELDSMRKAHRNKMAREKAAFEASLKKQRLSARAKANKLKAFRKKMAQKERDLGKRLKGLSDKIRATESKLAITESSLKSTKKDLGRTQAEKRRAIASIGSLKSQNKKLRSQVDTRRKIAKKMMKNFAKQGIKAKVNAKTGDVTISFGEEYFDAGKSNLKKGMKNSLQRFIPTYSKSLFDDPEVAKKIEAVEIIGFASPTYKGKFVNPQSLSSKDQAAVQYNLRLSQGRANSVFNYIFDERKIKYKHREELLPLVKVTGRSFLSGEIKDASKYEGMSHRKFCKVYDCRKSQRVIVKFSLKN